MNATILKIQSNPIQELKAIRAQLKSLAAAEEALKNQINNLLDSNGVEELFIDDCKVVRSITERNSFDSAAFKAVHSDLYTKFQKKTSIISLKTL